jgi:hypothetical protein
MPQIIELAPTHSAERIELSTNPQSDGPRITIHGSAADLLLLLWGRKALASFAIDGSEELAQEFLAQGVTP